MKNKQQIINELKQLTIDNKLQGVVSDELINILAYYLFENQAATASAVLESSISTCTKMSSFITHAKDYMFNVERPKGRYLYLYSNTLLNEEQLVQLDKTIIYEGNYKLLFDGSSVITKSVSGTNYYVYRLLAISDKYTYTINSSNADDIYINLLGDGVIELSDKSGKLVDNINLIMDGDLVDYISDDFSDYYYNTSDGNFNLFSLTTPSYGVNLYHRNINSQMITDNLNKKLIVYSNYTGEIKLDDIKRIKFSNSTLKSILGANWNNNNLVNEFYNSYAPGTVNNPLTSTSDIPELNFNTILVGDYKEPDVKSSYDLFLSYLGTKFGINSSNISKAFLDLVNEYEDSVNYATVISAVTMPADTIYKGEGDNPPGPLRSGKQIYSIIYSKNNNSTVATENFLDQYPIYRGFEWSYYKMFGVDYNPSLDSGGRGDNFLKSTNDKHIRITLSMNTNSPNYDSNIIYSELIRDLINSTYCNGRLFNGDKGSGFTISTSEIITLINSRLGIDISSLVIELKGSNGEYSPVSILEVIKSETNNYKYGANSSLAAIPGYYLRCPEYYSYLYLDDLVVNLISI